MKLASLITLKAVVILLVLGAFPQDELQKGMNQRKHAQMMKTMKDSSLVSMMMDSIAANGRMCMMMMQKLMHHAKADSARLVQLSKMMAGDKEMHATLTKVLDEQKHDSNSAAREILIKFDPGVQTAQVSVLESEVGLQQIKVIAAIDVRVFKITSTKSVNEVIALCEKKPFVKYAEPNNQYRVLNNN